MHIESVQTGFAQTAAPALSLAVALPQPTVAGNTLVLTATFGPLTGTPLVSDNFRNLYRLAGVSDSGPGQAVGIWTAEVVRGGAGHAITLTAQGGLQSLQASVSELSAPWPMATVKQGRSTTADLLLAILAQEIQQTALLQRLVTAERA